MSDQPSSASRRDFIKSAGIAVAGTSLAPAFVGAQDKSGSKNPIIGEGRYRYEVIHGWGELPDGFHWGETHGVAIDADGLIYIKHRSKTPTPVDAVVVFDPQGRYVRSFGKEYHGGGHGIDLRKEGQQEYLYLSDVAHGIVVKTNLLGEPAWTKGRPPEPGVYDDPSAKYSPTNVAFAPDGGFYIADGYGSNYIHQYDKSDQWVRTFGGTGDEAGKFKTPHGLWLDDRPGRVPSLVVADRANNRLQYMTTDGKHLRFDKDVSFPAHFDIRGDILLCPDLHARITLFDNENQVLSHLGYDPEWTKFVLDGFKVRADPSLWQPGKFVHPHDACFDKDGNIYVVEWVPTGRVSKLRWLA
ncbi:NHL repeat-containing protein [Singulisphaera rosea]